MNESTPPRPRLLEHQAGRFTAWCEPRYDGPLNNTFGISWPWLGHINSVTFTLENLDDLIGALTRLSNDCQANGLATRDEDRIR